MEIILYKDERETISIVNLSEEALKNKTIKQLAKIVVPSGLDYTVIDSAKLPEDTTYSQAWALGTKSVTIDIDKARDIKMGYIRELRNEKLAELDLETLKGVDVQAEKQVLRDLPEKVDLSVIEDLEELKAFIPEVLQEIVEAETEIETEAEIEVE